MADRDPHLLPHRRRRARLGAAAVAVSLLLGAAACSGEEPKRLAEPTATAGLPKTDGPVETFPTPTGTAAPAAAVTDVAFPASPFTTVTPKAQGQLSVYDAPGGAVTQTLANPKLVNNDPNAAVPLTLLVKDKPGTDWFEVYLPVRPNGSTGFVKAADVTTATHDFRIEVRLSEFNLKAYQGDKVILDAPIAVASEATPTPGGLYYTTELIRPPDPNGPYGTYAYGLSGFSETLETFGGGPGQLGIHGTNEPDKMGQRVSHGCIRLRNADIEQLAKVLPLGVPVGIYS